MIDIKFIRNNPEEVKKKISLKGADPEVVDSFLGIDSQWRKIVAEMDELKAKQNILSDELAKNPKDKEALLKEAKELKTKIEAIESRAKDLENQREKILIILPNLPLDDVPVGKEGTVLREVGEKLKFDFQPKDYLGIAEKLDLIDVERAAKVSGSRFGYLKNQAALLEFALIKLAFDNLLSEGFTPVVPPVMIKEEMMEKMGYVDLEEDRQEGYFLEKDKLYLVGTSEQSIGPMHVGEIFKEEELPKRYTAFSTCFRREAGSYGKDTKGILRVHQFDKVEMFSFCHPEKSKEEHQLFLKMEEKLMSALKIPYRVVQLGAADISRPSANTYDIEAWLPGQNQYRETHSCSNCTDFQARRLNVRFRDKNGNLDFVHTLNGTAFAIGRTIIAILENYQTKEGSVLVPEALRPYLGFEKII